MMGTSRITWTFIGAAAILLAGGLLWAPQSLRGDQVWSSGIHYDDATVESINRKTVTFVFRGKHLTKPNNASTRIEIEGFDPFNEAERLLAGKDFAEAKVAYQVAADKAKTDLQRQVARMRLALALNPKASASAKTATHLDDRWCYYCGNTGKMRCPDCNAKGAAKCPDCKNGYIPCTTCGGKGKFKCTKCEGAGKITSRNWQGQLVAHDCPKCGGRGFEKCSVCGTGRYPGLVPCPTCKGTDLSGVCPTCKGQKTVPCAYCDYGRKLRESMTPAKVASKPPDNHPDSPPDDPHDVIVPGAHRESSAKPDVTPPAVTQTPPATKTPDPTKPPERKAPEEPVNSDPLSSPDAMVRAIASFPTQPEKSPDWDVKSAPERLEAQQQYKKDLADWNKTHEYRKQHVRWRLIVQAMQPAKNEQDILLLADTKVGAVVGITFLKKDLDLVKSFDKEQVVWVSGTVKEYGGGPKDAHDNWFSPDNDKPYDILLIDPTVETGK